MATFLFDDIVFGPLKSRRLGMSLGINLLPESCKKCNFNCIYCECGWTSQEKSKNYSFHSVSEVMYSLNYFYENNREKLSEIDVITFAGNGEPTMHPKFNAIVENTIAFRNHYMPRVKIAVLSNATMLHSKNVVNALKKIDYNILKLDSGIEETIERINNPLGHFSLDRLTKQLSHFDNVIIQTMMVKGSADSFNTINNTTQYELACLLKLYQIIMPKQVMIYTISRDTPLTGLVPVNANELEKICNYFRKGGITATLTV